MLYCFLDTNILLEFKPIKDIKWLKALGTAEVCLVVTSVVLRELDKHKAGKSNRLRRRARNTISFFKSLDRRADNEIHPNVTLRFDLTEPKRLTLEKHNLSADVNDDLLIAKALEFRSLQESEEVAILTDDTVVQFKAEGYGLDVPVLSEEYRLPHEIDPLEQENRELKNELLKLQNNTPDLKIGFESDSSNLVAFSLAAVTFSAEYISKQEVKSLLDRRRYEILNSSDIEQGLFALPDYIGREMTRTDVYQYRDYVNSWLEQKYAPFLSAQSIHDVFHKRSIPVELTVQNIGLGTGENLNITLKISGNWTLELESPNEPEYPGEPASRHQWRITKDSEYSDSVLDFDKLDFEMTNPANPIITRTVEVDEPKLKIVRNSVSRIRPDESLKLYPLYLFPTNSDCLPKTFTIEYEILKDNPGPKQLGQLSVNVNLIDP